MRVLLSAYACEPGKGSEPGAGWAWARGIAEVHEVWVLTRENNRSSIEKALKAEPNLRLHPVYLDLPAWARCWKRGGRGLRLYYVLWQVLARRVAKRLHGLQNFDVAHHITFAIDSLPAGVIGIHGLPSVWGPVGGAAPFPWRLRTWFGRRGICGEAIRFALSGLARTSFGIRTARRADVIIAQNRQVAARFARFEPIVEPNIALDPTDFIDSAQPPTHSLPPSRRSALFVGNLIPLKGVMLAIEAISHDPTRSWSLRVFGDGPDLERATAMVRGLGLEDRVVFAGHRPREEVLAAMRQANALIFPSAHDSAAWAVAEAIMSGAFVVCLDLCGPAELIRRAGCGIAVPATAEAPRLLMDALNSVMECRPQVLALTRDRIPTLVSQWYSTAVGRDG